MKAIGIFINFPLTEPFFDFSERYAPESILNFKALTKLLKCYENMNVFLLIAPADKSIIEKFSELIRNDESTLEVAKRIVFCSRSPFVLYKVGSYFERPL